MSRTSLRERRLACSTIETHKKKIASLEADLQSAREEISNLRAHAEMAFEDALTGLPNRRAFDHAIEREMARARRGLSEPLTLVLMDVDHFKRVNDTYGHTMGDTVLRRLGGLLKRATRGVDFVGRYGGEEFVLLFPRTTLEDGRVLVERLRQVFLKGNLVFTKPDSLDSFEVTLSFGVAEWRGYEETSRRDREDLEDWKARADEALYAAKRGGRNRIECAP